MTTIKTTCALCGAIDLAPENVALELPKGGRQGDYRFSCPVCTRLQRRPASARMVSVLLATGVTVDIVNPEPISESEIEAFVTTLLSEADLFRLIDG
jgi:hypothetical protein